MKLASFDIFDTTLIRKCGVPENIFYLLSKYLYPENPICRTLFSCGEERLKRKLCFVTVIQI